MRCCDQGAHIRKRLTANRFDLTLQGEPNQHGTRMPRRTTHTNHSPPRLELQEPVQRHMRSITCAAVLQSYSSLPEKDDEVPGTSAPRELWSPGSFDGICTRELRPPSEVPREEKAEVPITGIQQRGWDSINQMLWKATGFQEYWFVGVNIMLILRIHYSRYLRMRDFDQLAGRGRRSAEVLNNI